jgi:hypothetical protein
MPRLTTEQRLERAQKAKAKAEAEIRSVAAKMREADRRADTRRKILLGGALLGLASQDGKDGEIGRVNIRYLLGKMTERDRAAFNGWAMPGPAEKPKQLPAPKQGEGK